MAEQFQDDPDNENNGTPGMEGRRSEFIQRLLFETPGGARFTQDSPILPNVWIAYANAPRSQQELILTTTNDSGSGQAALELRKMLSNLRKKHPKIGLENPTERKRARVSYIPGQIAVKLYFDELMRVVLPLTPWWHETYDALRVLEKEYKKSELSTSWVSFPQPESDFDQFSEPRSKILTKALMLMRQEIDLTYDFDNQKTGSWRDLPLLDRYVREIPPDLSWLIRIGGIVADCFLSGKSLFDDSDDLSSRLNQDFVARHNDRIEDYDSRKIRIQQRSETIEEATDTRSRIVDAFSDLYDDWVPRHRQNFPNSKPELYPADRVIWQVTKNRRIHLAVEKSALTVKADAARQLFNISCDNITWAVLDSGIDSGHPAFMRTTSEHEDQVRERLASERGEEGLAEKLPIRELDSRVVKTLDFTRLRELLDHELDIEEDDEFNDERHKNVRAEIAERMLPKEDSPFNDVNAQNAEEKAEEVLERLRRRIASGREINWTDLEDAIVVNNPKPPVNDHGTHVAGVLGADWIEDYEHEQELPLKVRSRRMRGICPDINIIDVRVFREDGLTDEFELLAAIQFLRWMNTRAGTMQVHGANISLSLIHEVRRFACGQTPICHECNEASANGMIMVAAAGNQGYEMADYNQPSSSDGYRSASITDPGNAESVITVGATHRKRPHEYGVSYFSSRGPTGDGRLKPDVVAPGEKIKGPTPDGRAEFKDGTSMATPHVSGVAAMLMARHTELIAKPEMVKSIICKTATDLGRERYFQGHGLVDALRALQSL